MLKKFFSYYKPHKRLFIIDFSSAVFVAILELAFPVAVQRFIDDLLPTKDWSMITQISILLLVVYIISTFLQYVVSYFGHKLGINIETDMRQQLFTHVQRQSFRFFDNTKTGHIMSRITNDLFDIGELAHHGPEDLFIAFMTVIGAFTIMYNINPELAIIAIVMVPFLSIVATYGNIMMNKAWKNMYGKIADVNARVEDSVSGVRVVQSFTNESFEIARFKEDNGQFRLAKLVAYKVMAGTHSSIYMLTRLVTLVVLVVGAWFTYKGTLSNGELVSFVLYVNVLIKPVDKITALLELYPKGMAGFKRFLELVEQDPEIQDSPNALTVQHLKGDITFEKVGFRYDEHKPVLNDISLSIKAGETIAFVGPSGAGKTTICSLIPRFYDVQEGTISVDGLNIQDITTKSLRSQIGIVQQDVFLFTGSIRENIAYGKQDASEEEIRDAAKKAHLEDMIASLPEGYDTQIGERGLKLSGGQKQRLAIARMFLKNPPILILDEATSALDTETERFIQKALMELAENRTTLIIAHRLATIRDADRVLVVTEDGIAEDGSYSDLVAQNGIFARLHNIQFQEV
ncbi:ABC transporter ATP-binding protein/permease [Psychrobacillus psychrodurans]|jgi:ATP-binding cassette subfamily B protein|uniref:ABC transporter ATP-binding protein/permease n=1 Tax=Psychrobacillus psychrodurans TaxID=126157 RepID=A0A9X3LAI2_9BACI|nr:ABC transporter ATP-binding protein [Psychrobacillus psychrodurans]MCK1997215.1 ABC transporter ATP-binding protein/permease [Psychrobacillus psychrodurans]MCZ8534425.1 ABC transporter ATP-binding protein/permease [Psychrobacillus psychrodurans]MCZ8541204.1 ABC transporter ATP-binding protein/permease [Psychrobacillus psychrodurans]SFM88160.1 ATP-binding cassette, subfamily B [Psychrobacillus psychrodurans]